MNLFDFDFKTFVKTQLPFKLRNKPKITAWFNVLINPVIYIYNLFRAYREENLYYLHRTGQVCHLEAVLNDKYDMAQRRIKVVDGNEFEALFIFQDAEERTKVFLYQDAENDPEWLYTDDETNLFGPDFVVQVPYFIAFEMEEMKALINKYRLTSKTYIIEQV